MLSPDDAAAVSPSGSHSDSMKSRYCEFRRVQQFPEAQPLRFLAARAVTASPCRCQMVVLSGVSKQNGPELLARAMRRTQRRFENILNLYGLIGVDGLAKIEEAREALQKNEANETGAARNRRETVELFSKTM